MPHRRRRRRRSSKLIAAAILVAAVAALGGGGLIGYAALKSQADELQAQLTTELQAGQKELEAGKASLTQANAKHDATLIAEATAHFVAAKDKFLAAGSLADNSQLLRNLEGLPAAGGFARSRHAVVSGIVAMGAAISDAGQDLTALDAELLKPSASGPAGRTLLTVIDHIHTGLIKVRADFDSAQKAAVQVDASVIPSIQQGMFLKARDTVAAGLAGLDEFERLVPVLVEVLGGNGPRTYLIEQVNPAELRAGGGFIGSYSLLRADHGNLKVVASGDSYDLAPRPSIGQPGFISQLGPLREVIPDTSWSFVDSNLFPDFPSNARAAMDFVRPSGANLDAVISMDYYTVAKMLELTGPLQVPGFGLTVQADTFVPMMIQHDLTDATHKAMLSAIAGPLMDRISSFAPDQWPTLIEAFNGLVAARHFQVYFSKKAVQDEIERVGWSGKLNPNNFQDYMMEVESNYGGSKSNYFLSRLYTVELTRDRSLLHHKITVDLINATPYGSYVVVHYRSNVRLYIGGISTSMSDNLQSVKFANPDPPAGLRLLDGWLPTIPCCGDRGQAVFEYDAPWPARETGTAKIYWQKQPGTVSDAVKVIWNDGNGHTYTTNGDLGQDRVIALSPTGVTLIAGQSAHAIIPGLSFG